MELEDEPPFFIPPLLPDEVDELLEAALDGDTDACGSLMLAALGADDELREILDSSGDPRWALLWAFVYGPIVAPR